MFPKINPMTHRPMTHRHYDTHIRIKPNSLIQSLYSGRTYTASNELAHLDVMAVLERDNYVFSTGIIQYAVSPDDVEIIDHDG